MNAELLQDLLAGAIAFGALAWLVARRLRARRTGAPACENCAAAGPLPEGVRPAPEPVVLLRIGEPGGDAARPRR